MSYASSPSRKKSWQTGRERVSVLAELAIRKETVSRKLAELRDAHDLTQERAAAHVGVTMRQWQRWEGGQSVPYPRNLDAIAERFGIGVEEFFDEPRDPGPDNGLRPVTQLDRVEAKLDTILEILSGEDDGRLDETIRRVRESLRRPAPQASPARAARTKR